MKIKLGHKNFAGAIIHYILLNKLNNYGETDKQRLYLFKYNLSLKFIGKINDWLMKNKKPYMIQIKLTDIYKGFDYALQTKNKPINYKHTNDFNEAIMFSMDLLLQKLNKTTKSYIPEEIDPEQIQGEINTEAFGG